MQKKIIIIGAGIAGLSAACMAVKQGFRVEIYEAQSDIGGDSRSLAIEGFQVDQNPKLFPAPYLLDTLIPLKQLSLSAQFMPVSPAVHIHFADRKKMLLVPESEISDQLNKVPSIPLLQGESTYHKLETVLLEVMNQYSGKSVPIWQRIFRKHNIQLNLPLLPAIQQFSNDPYMQQCLLVLAASTGIALPSLTAADLFLPALISRSGLFYPKHAPQSIVELLAAYLKQSGVKIFTRLPVTEILPVHDNSIGIRLGGDHQEWADYILNTTGLLAPDTSRFTGTQPMLVHHFGVKTEAISSFGYFSLLILNSNIKTWNKKREISHRWLPDYLYVHQPTICDPSIAPDGCSLLSFRIPLPSASLPYQTREIIRENLLTILEEQFFSGFRKMIQMEHVLQIPDVHEKEIKKMPAVTSTSQANLPFPVLSPNNRLTHLYQYYHNHQPTLPQILFASQRWLERLGN
jgi:phytoene desaturase